MTAPTDRVQLLKQESTALGGQDSDAKDYPVPINPQQDAPELMGVFLQDGSNRDENCYITRSGNDMLFRDATVAAEKTLTQLLTGLDFTNYVFDVAGGFTYTGDMVPVTRA